MRRNSRQVCIGSVKIGGDAPISVQSMTKVDTGDVSATVSQIQALAEAGCEIVRVAIPDITSAGLIGEIKRKIKIPLVADIHFDWRLAVRAIEEGADKIRLNPGNIYKQDEIERIVGLAKERSIPIRVGVNSGSLRGENKNLKLHEAMVESALSYVGIMERSGFTDIIISLKASDVPSTIEAYRLLSKRCDYPLHLGITAAGASLQGVIRSSVGLGTLLWEGLGDTIRVSLTGDPLEEVRAAYGILSALDIRQREPVIISCPTCGRCRVNLTKIVREVEKRIKELPMCDKLSSLKIAIMGCPVNGPGEAQEAEIGIACGERTGLLFKNGKSIRRLKEGEFTEALISEIKTMIG